MNLTILSGDCRDILIDLPDASVQCCVTSPPYWKLRDYNGNPRQIGQEPTPEEFIKTLVNVFREVRRILKNDGTLWVNIGDSYCAKAGGPQGTTGDRYTRTHTEQQNDKSGPGLKSKDLVGIPWMLAFALRADGWYLRQDIIWCLSGGSWLYARTQKGDMPIMLKDLVRLDPSKVKLWNGTKWTNVLGWGPSNDTSERLELVLRSGERIGCTGGHVWPTQRGNIKACELLVGDILQSCRLDCPSEEYRPGFLSDDLLWLLGLYLAEGSRADDTIQLSLNRDEAKWLPRILSVVDALGAKMTHTITGESLSVRIYGKVINAVIFDFIGGDSSLSKHLTTKCWMLSNDSLRHFVMGYLDGDGHLDGERYRLGFCRNYSLERDLRTLAARLGATLTLNSSFSKYQGGRVPSFRGEWRWKTSGHHNEKDRGEIVEIRKSRARKFWDISVEDEPHLFALASGVLTHNCKPNPMPESVKDRCTKSHEYIFLLSKSEKYYFDQEAILEPCSPNTHARLSQNVQAQIGSTRVPGKTNGNMNAVARKYDPGAGNKNNASFDAAMAIMPEKRNKRSVWTVPTAPCKEAHFATYPPNLIRPCILAGTRPGDTVLDPFGGSGTTGAVAQEHGRSAILIELEESYLPIIRRRTGVTPGLF